MTSSTNGMRFPNESQEYRNAREELIVAERELRGQIERVAAQRRGLPPGGALKEDYAFDEIENGAVRRTPFSDLFGRHDTLVVYNFMFNPKEGARPCPSCTSMLDGLDRQAKHLTQRVSLAVVARASIDRIQAFARERDWRNLRLLSSLNNSFNHDYFGESADGSQQPMLHIFKRRGSEISHFWSSEILHVPFEPGQDPRHIDLIWPLWNVLDLTPQGRGADWRPKLEY